MRAILDQCRDLEELEIHACPGITFSEQHYRILLPMDEDTMDSTPVADDADSVGSRGSGSDDDDDEDDDVPPQPRFVPATYPLRRLTLQKRSCAGIGGVFPALEDLSLHVRNLISGSTVSCSLGGCRTRKHRLHSIRSARWRYTP
jgi:hypothetical protein